MHRPRWLPLLVLTAITLCIAVPAIATPPAWTSQDLLTSPTPFALGHRGHGEFDLTWPQNTLGAFHESFTEGIRVVELDLQMTADGKVVVFHDDVLPNGKCVGAVTYDELLALEPDVPLFRAVLGSDRHFAFGCALSGLIFAEIKVPIPYCSTDTTSALAEVSESALVAAVVADIRQARMEGQVILNSGSPSILHQAWLQAPEMMRALSLNVLQLLDPATICPQFGYCPVHAIPKNDCGLTWYDVSNIARLPTFYPLAAGDPNPIQRFIMTALGCAHARIVSVDKLVFFSNPAAAPPIIAAMHQAGLKVVGWTVDTPAEANPLASWGVDGITTNNIEMGLELQAPLPPCEPGLRRDPVDRIAMTPAAIGLSLAPRENSMRAGSVRIGFTLPDYGAAQMDLLDIAGRRLDSRDVGTLGMGAHETTLGAGLHPGVYFVRLTHATGIVRAKVAVTR